MDNLNLPNPKQMDVAVPANLSLGFSPPGKTIEERTLTAEDAGRQLGRDDIIFVDLREAGERARDGIIPGSVHLPYGAIDEHVKPGSLLNAIASQTGKNLILYCAFGERSALALETLREAGIENVRHLGGGTDAWIKSSGTMGKV